MNFTNEIKQDETGIELTPLIDVVFLLLIFFMISTTFTKETKLNINLPKSVTEESQLQPSKIELHIGASGRFAIKSDKDPEAKVLSSSKRELLVSALKPYSNIDDLTIVIRADQNTTHGSVIKALDVLQELEMNHISFAAEKVTE